MSDGDQDPRSHAPAGPKPSVLVVDDEPDILFSLQALLRREFDVATAESGSAALELLVRRPTQVLMTDQRMPGMTGAELLARSQRVSPETVSIMFTGYADIKAVIEAINHGHVFRYITKPWDPDDLVGVIRDAVEQSQRNAQRRQLLRDARTFIARTEASPADIVNGQAKELLQRLDRATAL